MIILILAEDTLSSSSSKYMNKSSNKMYITNIFLLFFLLPTTIEVTGCIYLCRKGAYKKQRTRNKNNNLCKSFHNSFSMDNPHTFLTDFFFFNFLKSSKETLFK